MREVLPERLHGWEHAPVIGGEGRIHHAPKG